MLNDLEWKQLEKDAMALEDAKLREEALKDLALLRSLSVNPPRCDAMSVQERTPTQVRERPSLFESLRMYRDLKSNDPVAKKRALIECWAKDSKEDELIKRTRDKLVDPTYSNKIRKEFQSRKFSFNLFALLNCAMLVVFMILISKLNLPKEFVVIAATAEFFLVFFCLGNHYWRCPACNIKLDLNPSPGTSVSKSCPRCGAQFS
jgi:hypothetical protein